MRDNKDSSIWLKDIVEAIDLIALYLGDLGEEDFFNSLEKQDSVARRLGVVGEAVQNLSDNFKAQHPNIAWKKAAGMRNVVIHEYFDMDHDLVWKTLKESLPEFKKQILEILEKEK